jgi:hypothetical protein
VLAVGGYAVRVYATSAPSLPHGLATPAGTLPGLSELAPELVAALLDITMRKRS